MWAGPLRWKLVAAAGGILAAGGVYVHEASPRAAPAERGADANADDDDAVDDRPTDGANAASGAVAAGTGNGTGNGTGTGSSAGDSADNGSITGAGNGNGTGTGGSTGEMPTVEAAPVDARVAETGEAVDGAGGETGEALEGGGGETGEALDGAGGDSAAGPESAVADAVPDEERQALVDEIGQLRAQIDELQQAMRELQEQQQAMQEQQQQSAEDAALAQDWNQSQAPADIAATKRVRAALAEDSELSAQAHASVHVTTANGVVVLSGDVPSERERSLVGDKVRALGFSVENDLIVHDRGGEE